MKLTVFSRILLTLAILVGLFFVFRALAPQFQDSPQEDERTEAPAQDQDAEESVAPAPAADEQAASNFDYTPPEPVNGKLKGVVELGASGFNSFIIRVDPQKNWELEKAEFGASLVYENMATEEDVRSGLKQYISQMLSFGVAPRDIHFVVSSSAIKTPEVQKIRSALKTLNYVVNAVDATQEGKLALRATLPDEFQDRGFVVDIGSGNTKISWMENGEMRSVETYGSKYYQDDVSDEAVYEQVKNAADRVPAGRRQTCFIIGGVPFELAKQVRQGEERYTVLSAPAAYRPEGEKQESGLTIYRAIADATGCDTFVFDWHSNFTIGFLLTL